MLTYFLMHLASSMIRACSRRQGGSSDGEKQVILQTLTVSQWAWKVFPVAAASGLEVRPTALELQNSSSDVKPHLEWFVFYSCLAEGVGVYSYYLYVVYPGVGLPNRFLVKLKQKKSIVYWYTTHLRYLLRYRLASRL